MTEKISKQEVLLLLESRQDSPTLNWTPESFMSFLKYLHETISKMKEPDLWVEIMEASFGDEPPTIDTPTLYSILEKRGLVPDEKDGM